MKKFLAKFPVMIGLVLASLFFLALTIGLAARPVSTGCKYVYTRNGTKSIIQFKAGHKATMTIKANGFKMSTSGYYITNGKKVVLVDEKSEIEEYKKLSKAEKAEFWKEGGEDINAFSMGKKKDFKCGGAVACVVIFSLVTVACAAFTTLSVLEYRKSKKK